jgi:putative nucleotidyltransferase with HDIG domain
MMNAAIVTVLIAMLFNEQLALVINTVISVILALFISDEAGVFTTDAIAIMISSLTGGMAAIYVCKNVRTSSSRGKMLLPGAVAGIVGMLTAFAVMWTAGREMGACIQTSVHSLAGGAIAAIFSAASQPVWESMFGLLTQSKLLELSSSSSDLLRKMSIEVPGTYQHSSSVAEMAENGAKDIGANPMLARVGALYHDIGKLALPQYFTENNRDSSSEHLKLNPQMSSIIIRDHVKEGLALAHKYKLGTVVRDAIAQHHGNDLVRFFYRQAQEISRRTGEPVDEEAFRYQGPQPNTKESAIISLADACEAASRSLDKPTPERLEEVVDKIFEQRFKDGQLRKANITLAELEKVRESFVNTILSMKHGRIAYREEEEEDHEDPLSLETVQTSSDA